MRITVFVGHYGSGKTLLALNYALKQREVHRDVRLCDLDIVNPYYRASDARTLLKEAGIRLIVSPWANSSVELAGLPPDAASVFDEKDGAAIIDVGGDDRGALALGRFAKRLKGAEVLLVGNLYRPLTNTVAAARDICREIEEAGHFLFTGFVNNSNLGAHTTAPDVLDSVPWARELCEALSLPLYATAARRELARELADKVDRLWLIERFTRPGFPY